MKTTIYDIGPSCPSCGEELNAATEIDTIDSRSPAPGDVSVCASCSVILIYDIPPLLHVATQKEVNAMDPELRAMLRKAVGIAMLWNATHRE